MGFLEWLQSMHTPDLYVAENLGDVLESAPHLPFPWWKDFPVWDRDRARVYVLLMNVGIRSCYSLGLEEKRDHFIVHDDTGQIVMNWEPNRLLWPPSYSWEDVHEREGLMDDDWVYDLLFCWHLPTGNCLIGEVRKFKPRTPIVVEKERLTDRIRGLLPDLTPLPDATRA